MKTSLIVAMAQNRAIGKDNQLLWHLSADLKYFRQLTTNHHIVMGRKTYESIGKPLPNRVTVIVTRDQKYDVEGCSVEHSLEEALALCKSNNETETFIIGGGEIYTQALDLTDRIYLTEVKATIEGDVYFPEIDDTKFKETFRESHEADEKNEYAFDFVTLDRIQ
jgi:dihydrofolate reductase